MDKESEVTERKVVVTDYFCYGKPVLIVENGMVVEIQVIHIYIFKYNRENIFYSLQVYQFGLKGEVLVYEKSVA